MIYSVEYETEAIEDLTKLSPLMQKRIIKKIQWWAENFTEITPQPLKGKLSDFYKLRIGDYRIIYDFDIDQQVLIIDQIGHRSQIYD